ncbi:MAG TPA: carbamoyltransferase HypF [Casimicrobiaceae bacterium]|nr:carbamoyltransferase HypF [Casimicrobiaceae bacterium]
MTAIANVSRATRKRIEVRGIVQGVGFRPFVYRLADALALDGFVRNDGAGVTIEVQGDPADIAAMARRIAEDAPPRARVDSIAMRDSALRDGAGFAILDSEPGCATTAIGPDTAICSECLRELCDPQDRRYRYAFINCTHCGPRYTITRALPYDRSMTSMGAFAQCAACLREYRSPLNRRFHAEPNACPECGPRLALLDADGNAVENDDPIAATIARIRRGEVVAIKGLGGFHLACDARNGAAVAALRARKAREEKPFAVMAASVASLARFAAVSPAEAELLASPERPIVLMRKRSDVDAILPGVAPRLAWLGAMLPYTALHYLLFHEAAGRPAGVAWCYQAHDLVLVMTSANPGGEPLVADNDEAVRRLAGIADGFLLHDRAIVARCDDSVLRVASDETGKTFQFLRRARGYTPRAIKLARAGPSVVALGGHFKTAICVTRGDQAFVSQHIGDLNNAPTCRALVEAVDHLTNILQVEPAAIAHDLHPDFFSTRHAAHLAHALQVPMRGVQHHHAHIAAVTAEHRVDGPVLGVALDGVGLGTDGTAWGGELLRVDGAHCERLGRFAPLRLPGGDVAAREPWRMAAAALLQGGRGNEITQRFADEPAAPIVTALLEHGRNAPQTSSAGRYFDAAAGLLGVTRHMAFEGQAAMLLEGLAEAYGSVTPDADGFRITAGNELDLLPLLMRLADTPDAAFGASLFHATLIQALTQWIAAASRASGIATVACGGGCFLNAIVSRGLRSALYVRGIAMLEARALPPNDGGLALGQAWVIHRALAQE